MVFLQAQSQARDDLATAKGPIAYWCPETRWRLKLKRMPWWKIKSKQYKKCKAYKVNRIEQETRNDFDSGRVVRGKLRQARMRSLTSRSRPLRNQPFTRTMTEWQWHLSIATRIINIIRRLFGVPSLVSILESSTVTTRSTELGITLGTELSLVPLQLHYHWKLH